MPTDTKLLSAIPERRNRRIYIYLTIPLLTSLLIASCASLDPTSAPQSAGSGQTTREPSDGSDPGDPTPADLPTDDPDIIQAKWEDSSHSDTFVVGDDGINSTCTRCHAPFNFTPTMDDMPESCATCKFEVDPPPPFTPESDWIDIECKVCHKFKRDKIEPGFAWLEIAPIEEYVQVSSAKELCDKCHLAGEVSEHYSVIVEGDHSGYVCTDCHDAHDTTASCSSSECHEDTLEENVQGHDEYHASISCLPCHDGGGMEVDILEGSGTWYTYQLDNEGNLIPAASHNISRTAPCQRCHFPENPWGLSESFDERPE